MFLLFLYNYSSGMALYMTISTLAERDADQADQKTSRRAGADDKSGIDAGVKK
jgi:hypothetical protein